MQVMEFKIIIKKIKKFIIIIVIHITQSILIVTYACEIWSRTKEDNRKLAIWKKTILRNIYGSGYNDNLEIYEKETMNNYMTIPIGYRCENPIHMRIRCKITRICVEN